MRVWKSAGGTTIHAPDLSRGREALHEPRKPGTFAPKSASFTSGSTISAESDERGYTLTNRELQNAEIGDVREPLEVSSTSPTSPLIADLADGERAISCRPPVARTSLNHEPNRSVTCGICFSGFFSASPDDGSADRS